MPGSINDFWGGTYSAGILKSTNGGLTWSGTGLTFAQDENRMIHRLIINPTNPQTLFAALDSGLWRTTNGGVTWTAVISSGNFYDVEFNTANSNIVYASTDNGTVEYSSDGGNTWSVTGHLSSSSGRVSIAVTPADANRLYVWVAGTGGGFYKSTNGGTSFSPVTSPVSLASPYGYYDHVLNVSTTNPNVVYAGGMKLAKSTDGGNSWTVVGDWSGWPSPDYLHADQKDIEFFPSNGNVVLSCNDGGIFKSVNGGQSWIDISDGIVVPQYYRLGCAATDASVIYTGQQDQGVVRKAGTSWTLVQGGDGMECAVDPTTTDNVLISTQNGYLLSSVDNGATFFDVTPSTSGGAWTMPFEIFPSNPMLVVGGWEDVYMSNDGGWTWAPISSGIVGSANIEVLACAPSSVGTIYAGSSSKLLRTTNLGASWTNISAGLPLTLAILTDITVSDVDPQKIWVTLSGYSNGNKVFRSADGGATWTNISGSLPNVPANCIVYQNGSPDGIYIGTDFGVFFRDNSMSDWTAFDTGLPHCIVSELEIHYGTYKIRAATYGRGLWESDVAWGVGINEKSPGISINVYPNPSQGEILVSLNSASVSPVEINVTNVLGEKVNELTSFAETGRNNFKINLSGVPDGIYFVKVKFHESEKTEKVILHR